MRITVQYTAQAKEAAGTATEQLDLADGKTVADLLAWLAQQHGDRLRALLMGGEGKPHGSVLLVVGDEQVRPNDPRGLKDGDIVSILTPISGG